MTEPTNSKAEVLKETIRALPEDKGKRKVYSADLRKEIVGYVMAEQGKGRAVEAVSKELGIPGGTCANWLTRKPVHKAIKKKPGPKPKAKAKTADLRPKPGLARKKPGPKPGKKTAKLPNHRADTFINAQIPQGEFTYADGTLIIEGPVAKTVLVELLNGLT